MAQKNTKITLQNPNQGLTEKNMARLIHYVTKKISPLEEESKLPTLQILKESLDNMYGGEYSEQITKYLNKALSKSKKLKKSLFGIVISAGIILSTMGSKHYLSKQDQIRNKNWALYNQIIEMEKEKAKDFIFPSNQYEFFTNLGIKAPEKPIIYSLKDQTFSPSIEVHALMPTRIKNIYLGELTNKKLKNYLLKNKKNPRAQGPRQK